MSPKSRKREVDTGGEPVTFPTWNPVVPADMMRPDIRRHEIPGEARLYRPAAPAEERRPAVVVVQGLAGPKRAREYAYGQWLADQGYVAFVPSTFGTRAQGGSEHTWRALRVTTAMMVADAFASLAWLRRQPYVDPAGITVMGFSYGGMVAVLAAYRQFQGFFLDGGAGFAAHISYYGSSIPRLDDPTTGGAPVLMLLGDRDDNVAIERSRQIAADLRRGGSPVEVHVFEGAKHQWDTERRKPQFNLFSLRPCRIRVDRQGRLHDENTGMRLEGWISRLWFLVRNVSWRGYHIVRDDSAVERSNRLTLDFLARVTQRDGV